MWETELLHNMEYGNTDDTSDIYVLLDYGNLIDYNLDIGNIKFIEFKQMDENFDEKYPFPNVLVLMTIYIPEHQRNKKIFSNILTFLEKRAYQHKQHLYVGPLMTDDSDWIIHTCQKRGYKIQPPFGFIKFY